MLIDSCDDMRVIAEAANGEEAVDLTRLHRPDLVLMDIRMPVLDGLTATQRICTTPELAGTRVLIDRFLSGPGSVREQPLGSLATLTDREREIRAR